MTILTGKAHVQLLAEACCTQGGAATALRRRDMARQNLACPHILPCQRTFHPIANISGQAFIIEVLKLTAAAERKMSARRIGMVQPVDQAAVGSNPIARCAKGHMAAVGVDTVSLRCDANDFIGVCTRLRSEGPTSEPQYLMRYLFAFF